MTVPFALLVLVANSAAEGITTATYRFVRPDAYENPQKLYLAVFAAGAAILSYVWLLQRRDTEELRPAVRNLLLLLRVLAFAGLLFFFFQLERRSQREVVHNSRVLLLIDVSQSMGFTDQGNAENQDVESRIDQVIHELKNGSLLAELRQQHDVEILKFDRQTERLLVLDKRPGMDPTMASKFAETPPWGNDISKNFDWNEALVAQGTESRLGEALVKLLSTPHSAPLAAIILVSDGGQNAGVDPSAAFKLAQDLGIPVHTIGMGSDQPPIHVRVHDLLAPARAYPGDAFTATAYLQAQGLGGQTVSVDLLSRPAAKPRSTEQLEATESVVLGVDGEIVPVRFELSCPIPGRQTYRVRVETRVKDHHRADNEQEVDVEIVDRKSRVLLLASASTREYRFLLAQLKRDAHVTVDVVLQSSPVGISQDAQTILDGFPKTKEALYAYDSIVAFDPDWSALEADQMDLLEQWVSDEGGGLVVVAGPIHIGSWPRHANATQILNLYPVEFSRHLALLDDASLGSRTPWAIEWTQEGSQAEFLWLADNPAESALAWSEFPGVYGASIVKRAKLGATVYAYCTDSPGSNETRRRVYLAGHFYGSGRVFYIGSGELWRLRGQSEAHFERLYTKMLRHVSQSRLLRGSTQGMLLIDRDRYLLGDTVDVWAQLYNEQHEALEVPSVTLQLTQPDLTRETIVLAADPTRRGMYAGQFTTSQEGTYRLDLSLPDAIDEQLTKRVQVRMPELERVNPQRNNALLNEIALATNGHYCTGLTQTRDTSPQISLANAIADRTEVAVITGLPDRLFEGRQMRYLLMLIAGLLCVEWLVRRLCKLA